MLRYNTKGGDARPVLHRCLPSGQADALKVVAKPQDKESFSGVWCPLVTPFRDGEVDHDALGAIALCLAQKGVQGFVAAGQTGEIESLSLRERLCIAETVIEATSGAVPVLVGIHDGDACATAREIAQFHLPVAGFVLSVPEQTRPGRNRLMDHFLSAADATEKPLVLSDRHSRGNNGLTPDILTRLFRTGRFPAVVLESKALENLSPLIEINGPRILCGGEDWFFVALQVGAHGGVLPMANVASCALCETYDLFVSGRLDEAWTKYRSLRGLSQRFAGATGISALKTAMVFDYPLTADVRAPLPSIEFGAQRRIRSELREFHDGNRAA